MSVVARFWDHVEDLSFHTDEDCWNWIGCFNDNGRPCIRLGRKINAAKYIRCHYENNQHLVYSGNIVALQLCNNKTCINPHHIKLTTQSEFNKHQASNKFPELKLTKEHVDLIFQMAKMRNTHGDIARKLNINRAHITRILGKKRKLYLYK